MEPRAVMHRAARRWASITGPVAIVLIVLLGAACKSEEGARATSPAPGTPAVPSPSSVGAGTTAGPGTTRGAGGVVVRGTATVDGAPFDARFLGAVVRENGLTTACQAEIPSVAKGQFEIRVHSASEGDGCGRPGSEIALWTYVSDQRVFSTTTVPWPSSGTSVTFDPQFSTASPRGSVPEATELAGEVTDRENFLVEPGARVEAFVGDQLCGVSTIRENGDFVGFALSVVGPDAVPGCARDGMITFKVGGQRAKETLKNDGSLVRSFDLTLE